MTGHAKPNVAVDVVLLTLEEGVLKVALHERNVPNRPFFGKLALPGGYIHVAEDFSLMDTAYRVLKTKTGIVPRYLEQLYTFAGTARDPDGWSVSVSYVALVPIHELRDAGQGVFHFFPVDSLPELAFDHSEQVAKAVARIRDKSAYSTLPCWLLPEEFTLTELQKTYEQIGGLAAQSRSTFRAKLGIKAEEVKPGDSADNGAILIATDRFKGGHRRPTRLFRVNHLSLLKRPLW